MKKVSIDQTYVDYTAERVGVRVRRNVCRPIIFERGRWIEYGVSYSIPLDLRQLHLKRTGMSSLASNLALVDASGSSELRRLVAGEISFEDVTGHPGRKPGEFTREALGQPELHGAQS